MKYKIILMLCLLFFSRWVLAQEYYVNASTGSDVNTGMTPGDAWKTVARVNAAVLATNDVVYFNCGDTWNETLVISGSARDNTSYAQYGLCTQNTKPVISGAMPLTGWAAPVNGIYSTQVSSNIGQLFYNGTYIKLAQHPNNGYWSIDQNSASLDPATCQKLTAAHSSQCYLTDAQVSEISGFDLSAAGMHIRSKMWMIEDRQLTDIVETSPGVFQLWWDKGTRYSILQGYGYYLDNKRWMLDDAVDGEWHYDVTTQTLSVLLPAAANPGSGVVAASWLNTGILIQDVSNVTVSNLQLNKFISKGVYALNANNINLINVDVYDTGSTGIYFEYENNGSITGSIVKNSVNNAIMLDNSFNVDVIFNYIENSGTVGSPRNSLAAINVKRPGLQMNIENNTIINSGYIGVRFTQGASVVRNTITDSCQVLNDCGAIYTWEGNRDLTAAVSRSYIQENIIQSAKGNLQGTPGTVTQANGIYLDDQSKSVTVLGNTIANVDRGLQLNNPEDIDISNNTVYAARDAQLNINDKLAYIQRPANNTVSNNVFFQTDAALSVRLKSEQANSNLASFSNNHYADIYIGNPMGENLTTIYDNYQYYNLLQWQQQKEASLTAFGDFSILPFDIQQTVAVEKVINPFFDSDVSGWLTWPRKTSAVTEALLERVSDCDSNPTPACAHFVTDFNQVTQLYTAPFTVEKDKVYFLEFKMKSISQQENIKLSVIKTSSPYTNAGLNLKFTVNPQWTLYRYIFTANQTFNSVDNSQNVRLNFFADAAGEFYIDDVSIKEVVQYRLHDASEDSILFTGNDEVQNVISCPFVLSDAARCNEYVDIFNNPVTWPFSVASNSRIVIWKNPVDKDSDRDGISDIDDNCSAASNLFQFDADQDNYGNFCDADVNNDNQVDSIDYTALRNYLSAYNSVADFNGDKILTAVDYSIMRAYWGRLPGPSGLVP